MHQIVEISAILYTWICLWSKLALSRAITKKNNFRIVNVKDNFTRVLDIVPRNADGTNVVLAPLSLPAAIGGRDSITLPVLMVMA